MDERAKLRAHAEEKDARGQPRERTMFTTAAILRLLDAFDTLREAAAPFAALRADDGDIFASYPSDMIVRCECSVREILALRAALSDKT